MTIDLEALRRNARSLSRRDEAAVLALIEVAEKAREYMAANLCDPDVTPRFEAATAALRSALEPFRSLSDSEEGK